MLDWMLEQFPEDLDGTNTELVRDWAIQRLAPYLDDDYDFDLVEYLGGEEEARAWVERCWSTVAVPENQVGVIRLLEQAGFQVVGNGSTSCNNDNASDAMEDVDAGDNGTAGGDSAPYGGGGDNSNTNLPLDKLNDSLKPSRKRLRAKKVLKRFSPRKKKSDAEPTAIMIVNQRGDLYRYRDRCAHVVMEISDRTSIRHVKDRVFATWGVTHGKQCLCKSNRRIIPVYGIRNTVLRCLSDHSHSEFSRKCGKF